MFGLRSDQEQLIAGLVGSASDDSNLFSAMSVKL
jgi:hypothetical protein